MVLLELALAILAFLIYGFGVLSLHPERHSRWLVEADFSLAAGVSYSVYKTPLGMANANVAELFRSISRQKGDDRISVQEAMARTAAGDLPAGALLKASTDGNGAGYPVFASFAMRLFGPHLSALIYSFLLMMGISTLVFVYRFRDDRLFMVPLQFFALTLMLLSPLASNTWPVRPSSYLAGLRYFSVAGILPALHIFFEVTDRSRAAAKAVISNFILLGLQDTRDEESSCRLPGDVVRFVRELFGWHDNEFGLTGSSIAEPDNLLARDDGADIRAGFGDHAGEVTALSGGECGRPTVMQEALSDHRLARVDTRRLDLDQHLTRTRRRSWDVANLEHIDAAVRVELHCLTHTGYDRMRRAPIPVPRSERRLFRWRADPAASW